VSTPPVWIDAWAILFLDDESLAMFSGARGLRDAGLFESALSRPVNQRLYKPDNDIADLAAACASGLAKNHPFVDGNNKRTAFLALGLFIALNGWRLKTTQLDAIETMRSLATGNIDERGLADWIRVRIQPAR
jgi:death-on-curing protein